MPSNLHDVIEVCDQVEHNRRDRARDTQDLARRAHAVFQDQGLEISVDECQRAAQQLARPMASLDQPPHAAPLASSSAWVAADTSIVNAPFMAATFTALAPVVAVGMLWALFDFFKNDLLRSMAPAITNSALDTLDPIFGLGFLMILTHGLFRWIGLMHER